MTEEQKWENIFLEDCAEYDKKIKEEQMAEYRMIPLRQMAKKLGISVTYLYDIEKGRRNPSNEVYRKMLKEYRAGVKKFFKVVVEPKIIRIKEGENGKERT